LAVLEGRPQYDGTRAPDWYRRESALDAVAPSRLRLLILHWDKYPTARAVYLDHFPGMGHEVVWAERGSLGQARPSTRQKGLLTTTYFANPGPVKQGNRLLRFVRNRLRTRIALVRKAVWVWRTARGTRFDYIQARDLLPEAWLAWIAARLFGAKFAFQLDFPHFEGHLNRNQDVQGIRVAWRRLVWRTSIMVRDFLMSRADVLFVISEAMRDVYIEKNFDPARLHVFPVGVGERFREANSLRASMRDRLGVHDEPVVVYLGNLTKTRDAGHIVSIIAGVVRQVPQVKVLILGKGCSDLREMVDEQGIGSSVVYAGTVDHEMVPGYLSAADVGIYPIDVDVPRNVHQTMSPLKVAEYMASATATVASPIPEAAQLLRDSGAGVVTPGNDRDQFVREVARLCRSPEVAREMGMRGQRYIYRYKAFSELARLVERAYLHHRASGVVEDWAPSSRSSR
jgi:glycosyltransferase involved in cell wall biosynthesis